MSTLSSVSLNSCDKLQILDVIQGEDKRDSNCVDFTQVSKIRYADRIQNTKIDGGCLKGLRVGILDEFNIEELDDRNRTI